MSMSPEPTVPTLALIGVGAAILAVLILLYAAFASQLARWWISMPMVFVTAGFLLGPNASATLVLSPRAEGIKQLTEITLALILFADASTLHFHQVRDDATIPLRLLTIGLLLTVSLGALVAIAVLPGEGLALAALLGALLAPTDAALGLPIFSNPQVPVRIRRALNVESGLNDGIATPLVTLFIAYAAATEGHASAGWLSAALVDMGLAALVGIGVGAFGGWLLGQSKRRGWTSSGSLPMAILGLALCAYFGALTLDANGFIAAFVAGLTFGRVTRNRFAAPTEFTETFSTILSVLVWSVFGTVLVSAAIRLTTDWQPIVYAVLSLTVVRMLPVAVALLGMGLRRDTVLLMGWFGPRGLASVVFTLLALVDLEAAGQPVDTLVVTATWTILLSVVLHGLTAQPLSAWYARRLRGAHGPLAELVELPELRRRHAALAGAHKQD
jgi:NhaP-type Na+/H+ or K+/H+ antiporter